MELVTLNNQLPPSLLVAIIFNSLIFSLCLSCFLFFRSLSFLSFAHFLSCSLFYARAHFCLCVIFSHFMHSSHILHSRDVSSLTGLWPSVLCYWLEDRGPVERRSCSIYPAGIRRTHYACSSAWLCGLASVSLDQIFCSHSRTIYLATALDSYAGLDKSRRISAFSLQPGCNIYRVSQKNRHGFFQP